MRVELSNVSVAIEEGASLVRVDTAIFGKRTPMRLRSPPEFE